VPSVRPFVERDVADVGDLHRRVFRKEDAGGSADAASYRRYFAEVFLNGAVGDSGLRSLVYERDGAIRGFLGIMPRRMSFRGTPVLMAVCSQFVVDPLERGQAGLQLLRRCLSGPQDLSFTDEANDHTRAVWHWCGGETSIPGTLRWVRPLRPVQFALTVLARRRSRALMARAARSAGIADAAIRVLTPASLRLPTPEGSREELDETTFLSSLTAIAGQCSLRPEYDAASAAWVFDRAGRRPGYGRLRRFVVRNGTRHAAGYVLYCIGDDGTAEVLQIAAPREAVGPVLDHLFHDAMECGALAVRGRMDSALLGPLSERHACLYGDSQWTLLHSKRAALLHALHRGDAFLTRLEGEWCLRYP
jgi:hypothetical protein